MAVIFCIVGVQTMILILVPLKAVALGVSVPAAAALVALWGLVGAAADLPSAFWSDRVGRRRATAAAGLVLAISALGIALSHHWVLLLVGFVASGVGASLATASTLAFLTEVADEATHARVQGVNGGIQGIGTIVAALMAGTAAEFGLSAAFLPALVLSALAAILVWRVPESRGPLELYPSASDFLRSYAVGWSLVKSARPLQVAAIISILYGITFWVVASSLLPVTLVEQEHYSVSFVGTLVAVRNTASACISFSFGRVVARFGLRTAVVTTNAAGIASTVLLAFGAGHPAVLWLAMPLHGVGTAYGAAAVNLLVASGTSVATRATGLGAAAAAGRIAVLIMAVALGVAIRLFGVFGAFLTAATVSTLLLGALLALARASPLAPRPAARTR